MKYDREEALQTSENEFKYSISGADEIGTPKENENYCQLISFSKKSR